MNEADNAYWEYHHWAHVRSKEVEKEVERLRKEGKIEEAQRLSVDMGLAWSRVSDRLDRAIKQEEQRKRERSEQIANSAGQHEGEGYDTRDYKCPAKNVCPKWEMSYCSTCKEHREALDRQHEYMLQKHGKPGINPGTDQDYTKEGGVK